jgi:hypothetical protein
MFSGTTPTLTTTNARTGSALSHSQGSLAVYIDPLGASGTTGTVGRNYYFRAHFRFSSNASGDILLVRSAAATTVCTARLETNGTVTLRSGGSTQVGAASAVLAQNTWHRIELRVKMNAGTNDDEMELLVNGVQAAVSTTQSIGTAWSGAGYPNFSLGGGTGYLFDDVAINDDQGVTQFSWPGDGKVVWLDPAGDGAAGTGWTNDQGAGAGSFWDALNNNPPTGIADTTTGGGTHQIRNAVSAANSIYGANSVSYTAAGVGATDVITVLTPVAFTGAPVVTSAKAGTLGFGSNPVSTMGNLAAGGTAGAFWSGVAAGTFPTGWKRSEGPSVFFPTVVKGTRALIQINQVTSSTRVAMVCALGAIVEYVPTDVVLVDQYLNEGVLATEYGVTALGGTVAYSTAHGSHDVGGVNSLRINRTGTTQLTCTRNSKWGSSFKNSGEFWIWVASLPTANIAIWQLVSPSGDHCEVRLDASGNVTIGRQSSTNSTASATKITAGSWFRISWGFDTTSTTWQARVAVNDDTFQTFSWTGAVAGEAPAEWCFGPRQVTTASLFDIYYDDGDAYVGWYTRTPLVTGTTFPISVGGTITPAGVESRVVGKGTTGTQPPAGTVTPAGALSIAPVPNETVIDSFDRADGVVNAGAGSTIWAATRIDAATAVAMRTISNALGDTATGWMNGWTQAFYARNTDLIVDCLAKPTSGEFTLWFALRGAGATTFSGYALVLAIGATDTWAIRSYTNGVSDGNLVAPQAGVPTLTVGDSIWIKKRGTSLEFYRRPSGGNWTQVFAATNATYDRTGSFGIELSDTTQRWDSLRGGPVAVPVSNPLSVGGTITPVGVPKKAVTISAPRAGTITPSATLVAGIAFSRTFTGTLTSGGPTGSFFRVGKFPSKSTTLDDFDRANGSVDVGGPGIWNTVAANDGTAQVVVSALRMAASAAGGGVRGLVSHAGALDYQFEVPVLPTAASYIKFWWGIANPGSTFTAYALRLVQGSPNFTWELRGNVNGTDTGVLASAAAPFAAGDTVGVRQVGPKIDFYRYTRSGGWSLVLTATNTLITPATGRFAFEFGDTTARVDVFRGGSATAARTGWVTPDAAVTPAGAETRQLARTLTGTITPGPSADAYSITRTLTGSTTPTGALAANKVAGTTTYPITPGGTLSPTGAEVRSTAHLMAGTVTSAGVLARTLTRAVTAAGTITSAGVEKRSMGKLATGTLSPTGGVARNTSHPMAGTITPAGAETRQTGKKTAGAVAPVGVLTKSIPRALAGTITSVGALARSTAHGVAGTLAPTGALAASRAFVRAFAGAITPGPSALVQQTRKGVGGSVTPGTSALRWALTRTLTGALGTTGATTKSLPRSMTGTVTSAGTETRQTAMRKTGTITPTASVTAMSRAFALVLTAALVPAATLKRAMTKTMGGALAPAGAVSPIRGFLLSLGGTVAPAGTLARNTGKALSALVAPTGAETRKITRTFAGTAAPAGVVARSLARRLTGTITPAATLRFSTTRALAGSLAPIGNLFRSTGKPLTGAVGTTGALARNTAKKATGTITPASTFATSKAYLVALSAALNPIGIMRRASTPRTVGSATPTSIVIRTTSTRYTGSTVPAGTETRQTARRMTGSVSPAATLATARAFLVALSGALAPIGALRRSVGKSLAGALAPSGAQVKSNAKRLTAALPLSGADSVSHAVPLLISGVLAPVGLVKRSAGKALGGAVAPVSAIRRALATAYAGLLSPQSDLLMATEAHVEAAGIASTLTFGTPTVEAIVSRVGGVVAAVGDDEGRVMAGVGVDTGSSNGTIATVNGGIQAGVSVRTGASGMGTTVTVRRGGR